MNIELLRIENILVVRNDRLGEFILSIPVFRALKQTFPHATITAVVSSVGQQLSAGIPYIDDTLVWENAQHCLGEKIGLIRALRKKKTQLAVILNPSKELNVITYLAGIPFRIGYDRKCGFLLTHKIKDAKNIGLKHEVEYNLDLLDAVGIKPLDTSVSFTVSNDEMKKCSEKFGLKDKPNLVAVHPWTSDNIKQWPLERFETLIQHLQRDKHTTVVVIGGAEESNKRLSFGKGLKDKPYDLTGKTTLMELAALLKHCRLLISGDSGPVHLAAAVHTPSLVMFRGDIPGKSAKRWGPRGRNHAVIEKNSLTEISVEEVAAKAKEMLSP